MKKKKNKTAALQLDMFANTDFAPIATRVEEIGASADNVRRGLFARLDALTKRVEQLEAERAVKVDVKRCEIISLQEYEA